MVHSAASPVVETLQLLSRTQIDKIVPVRIHVVIEASGKQRNLKLRSEIHSCPTATGRLIRWRRHGRATLNTMRKVPFSERFFLRCLLMFIRISASLGSIDGRRGEKIHLAMPRPYMKTQPRDTICWISISDAKRNRYALGYETRRRG